ncbi:2-amino-4-hydroxy-6-hydroxymethyldihydropteridine diphosphokinase [Sediminibacterium sp. TEGAF015]|uniref:2-amino-4-hydroxy-6- hydroxymethyldihydropteridine diphosphokinase n=1 Tax=Sediminibacterium sp. TEGAF015 TaxID=575378 RepID=UPI00220C29D8|nr:2-amino-4-hydroxy-6-hydroxymethyldihydropteridine diphosphokinase [Sediminibacterium sp. TEGAF015]BDQ11583.1 2-amino-4-hydroxy-6-hydroxymethyldihydropteridine diphosphokinase [Sediminibacterium sp. TEGAF015]
MPTILPIMQNAYLLIGSNLGNKTEQLEKAVQYIQQECGQIVKRSAFYETAPWGFTDQPAFMNQALWIQTKLEPEALMQRLLNIEARMGRIRTVKLGPRIIDLDILQIDQLVIDTSILQIPHPAMTERRFALAPLAEIAPDLMHPKLQKTASELLLACTDDSDVQKKMA